MHSHHSLRPSLALALFCCASSASAQTLSAFFALVNRQGVTRVKNGFDALVHGPAGPAVNACQ
jgi:hypothetical protein